MKKLLALITACVLLLLTFAACANETEESSSVAGESSNTEQSLSESKPWYEEIVSAGEASLPQNDNSAGQSVPEQSSPEQSEPDYEQSISEPDIPEPDYSVIEPALNGIVIGSANGYRIAFTKESALIAEACFTNTHIAVTAIYDGAVTRFFGAVNGEYYTAIYGEYLYPCHDGFYDISSGKKGDFVEFTFDESGAFVSADETNHIHTEPVYEMNFYSPFNKKAYAYDRYTDHERLFVYENGEGAAICRELLVNCDIEIDWKNGSFALDESNLGKYGLVEDGKIIIPFEYDSISTYLGQSDLETGNTVGVVRAEKDGRFYYISTNGVNLTPEGFDCGSQPFSDRAWVFNGGQGWILEFN